MVVTSGCNTEKRVLNSLGTLDQVIQENKIFTALAKMPEEVQTTLLQNGWIGKDSFNESECVIMNAEMTLILFFFMIQIF